MSEHQPITILRDGNGKFIKGTAPPNTTGRRGKGRRVADIMRHRYRGLEGEERLGKLIDVLEDIAFGYIEAKARERIEATVTLLKMYQGKELFAHDGPDAGAVADKGSGAGRRQLFSVGAVDRQQTIIAEALGVPVEKLTATLEAVLEWREQQVDDEDADQAG